MLYLTGSYRYCIWIESMNLAGLLTAYYNEILLTLSLEVIVVLDQQLPGWAGYNDQVGYLQSMK
jgi:hypothetical protein